jgi:hypothetical protein
MNWTPEQIGAAIGASSVVTQTALNSTSIVSCEGLSLEAANERLALCVSQDTLTPSATMWQVRAWMIRHGHSPAAVAGIIEAAIPAGPEREEALMRWEYATTVPPNSPLLSLVAAQLQLNAADLWWDIMTTQ